LKTPKHRNDLGGAHTPKVTRLRLLGDESLALVLRKIISSTLKLSQDMAIRLERYEWKARRGLEMKDLA
jgi:hypothetical protein